MAIADVYRLSVVGRLHNQQTVNTFYYEWFSGGTLRKEGEAAQSLVNGWLITCDAIYRERVSREWALMSLNVQVVSAGPGLLWRFPQDGSAIGTTLVDSLPTSTAVVLRRRSVKPGRQGYGRVYLPAVPISWVVESHLTPAQVINYASLLNVLNVNYTNDTIVWSPRHASAIDPEDPVLYEGNEIMVWQVDDVVRSQRRRQPGVGA